MNPTSPAPATLAPLWFRLFAAVYDLFPVLALWFVATTIALLARGGALDVHRWTDKLLVQALIVAFTGVYFVVSWRRGGQTIGMKPWRLRIVRADGGAIDANQALIRCAVAFVSLLALGIGFLWALFDPQKRTWHDIAAKTLMVRVAKA
ncbi:MAG TPA: RDD family protein [Rudaea sp.]